MEVSILCGPGALGARNTPAREQDPEVELTTSAPVERILVPVVWQSTERTRFPLGAGRGAAPAPALAAIRSLLPRSGSPPLPQPNDGPGASRPSGVEPTGFGPGAKAIGLQDDPADLLSVPSTIDPLPLPDAMAERLDGMSILLVEDNPGDIRLVREAFDHGARPLRLTIVHDGLEALMILQRAHRKPDLILLDLNLPGLDGRSVLRRIKSAPETMRIPVVVLTNSDAPQDVRGAYDLHANCYLVKPPDYAGFERALRQLVDFWGEVAHLPDA